MLKKKYHKLFPLTILIILLSQFFFSSCASTSGNLSDAMDKASDDYEGERVVESYEEEEDEEEEVYYEEDDEDDNVSGFVSSSDSGTSSLDLKFGISFGSGLLSSNDYYGLNHANAILGDGEHSFFYFSGGFAWSPIQETSELSKSLDGSVKMLNVGIGYRGFTTPSYTFLGQYFAVGLNYNLLMWSYKNSIEKDVFDSYGNYTGTSTINGDILNGVELYGEIGLNLFQTDGLDLGMSISPGVILWMGATGEGFNNDVFDSFYYLKFKFNILLKNK